MKKRTISRRNTLMIAVAASMVLLLSACQRGGVSSDDAALIRQQLEDVATRLNVVEDRIDQLASEATGSEMLISQVRRELSQARDTLAEVDDKLAPSEPEITDDGLGAPMDMDPFNMDPDPLDSDPLDGFDAPLNDLGNFLDGAINGLDDTEAPYIPGTGGGATETVPGIPANPDN